MADLTSLPEENYDRSPFIRRDPMRSRYLREPLFLTILLTVVAILLCGWAVNQNGVASRSIPTHGVVTASRMMYNDSIHDTKKNQKADVRYETVITYTDPNGMGHTLISHIGYKVGQQVDLILDADNYSIAKTGTAEFNKKATTTVFAFALLFPLSSGAWGVYRWKAKERCRWLMKHGAQIEAKIVEELRQATKYSNTTRASDRTKSGVRSSRVLASERYWRLSYRDPASGRSYTFLSFFGNFPEHYDAVGKVATVYVDRQNFENYYVDLRSIRDPEIVQKPHSARHEVPTW
jgi:hypothetical protein